MIKVTGGDHVKSYKHILLFLLLFVFTTTISINMVIATDTVTSTSTCTCGMNHYGYYQTITFIDWCPLCGRHDCLNYNPKGAEGGEWTCTCGADYCAYDGWDKSGRFRAQLTRYVPEPELTSSKMEQVQPVPMTPLEIAQTVYQNNSIIELLGNS